VGIFTLATVLIFAVQFLVLRLPDPSFSEALLGLQRLGGDSPTDGLFSASGFPPIRSFSVP